jgi:hypothetical protein
MAYVEVLRVNRIGQITGTTGPAWPNLVDPTGRPLLTDTGPWNIRGLDLGANVLHPDGVRTYIFFGDAATTLTGTPPENADPVMWFDEPEPVRHGGHLALGWNFQLPSDVEGQDQWRYCVKCSALFWNGSDFKGRCFSGEDEPHLAMGINFTLPFEPTTVQGQHGWRFCVKCTCLFWKDDEGNPGLCPAGGSHDAAGLVFVIPVAPGDQGGQQDWRFCGGCHGLFFDGYPTKGICKGAAGGGVHLHCVTQSGKPSGPFDPIRAPDPIGYFGPNETPNGAFFWENRLYMFSGFDHERYAARRRPGLPQHGQWLFSKPDPTVAGAFDTEFLVSPKLGWCALDDARTKFESHFPLGFRFFLPHDLADPFGRSKGWRACKNCEAIFFAGDEPRRGICQRGGPHEADPTVPGDFTIDVDVPEDAQNQSNWHECDKCASLFWSLPGAEQGRCPAGGVHESTGRDFRIPHNSLDLTGTHQPDWRFCRKCGGLYWRGEAKAADVCPKDHGNHDAAGFNFLLPFRPGTSVDPAWRFCVLCRALFFEVADSVCPANHIPGHGRGPHVAAGWLFPLSFGLPASAERQTDWRRCHKCSGLFFDGSADKGHCPADNLGHEKALFGDNFALDHNPGADANMREDFRFCVRCHGLVRSDQPRTAPWSSPVVVRNARHPLLPQTTAEHGLVMVNFDWKKFHLSWMPLIPGERPRFDTMRRFHKRKGWTEEVDTTEGFELFSHLWERDISYTHVSAAWLDAPGCWIVLYAEAWDKMNRFSNPIVARFSLNLVDWTNAVMIFDPGREGAYGVWMHEPGVDRIHPDMPPPQDIKPGQSDQRGWAYGAFIIEKFTKWIPATRTLHLTYLMSTGSPYQVHLMETDLRLPDPVA